LRSLDIYKRQHQRLVGEKLGQNLDRARPWSSQQAQSDFLAEIFALPVNTANVVDLNDSSGALYFVLGLSDPGGDDIL
jgi:hypothetical protein